MTVQDETRHHSTTLLEKAIEGDHSAADEFMPIVYDELHGLALAYMRRERADHTLQPTALIHEAYLKLVDCTRIDWRGRTHFRAMAAIQMSRILIDHSRKHRPLRIEFDPDLLPLKGASAPDANVREVLRELEELRPRLVRVVALRFFAGLTMQEVADELDLSLTAVERDWRFARAWLYDRLKEEPA